LFLEETAIGAPDAKEVEAGVSALLADFILLDDGGFYLLGGASV
jgi:hypothetical protein